MSAICHTVVGRSNLRALGTTAEVLVSGIASLARATALLREELERMDLLASRFRADSELSHLNVSRGRAVQVSQAMAEQIDMALRAARLTDGAVDPTVEGSMNRIGYDRDFAAMEKYQRGGRPPAQPIPGWECIEWDTTSRTLKVPGEVTLDVAATAKAVCADRAAMVISRDLGCGVLVSIGGDLSIAGPPPEEGWRVGIADESGTPVDQAREVVALQSGGLATSGTSARSWVRGGTTMHHLIDPSTGLPVESPWRTVAVAAASCVDANVAATAALIKGRDAPRWLSGLGLPAVLVGTTGDLLCTEGWPSAESS